MALDATLAFFHFLFVFILVGALSAEMFVMRLTPNAQIVALVARIDIFYGLSALGLIVAGVLRVMYGAKGPEFYMASHAFAAKMAVFFTIGVLSIWPTMTFLRWRRAAKTDRAFTPAAHDWKKMRRFVTIETHLLALVIVFAVLTARAIG